jgi:CRISPR-associated protein Cmr1
MRWEISARPEPPRPPKVAAEQRTRKGMKTLTLKNLTLATPMLGGGVEALKNDNELPIRGQAIRGQLRFWWRTFQGISDIQELHKQESQLWGSTRKASRVGIQTQVLFHGTPKPYPGTNYPKYVLFPLDNATDQKKEFSLREGLRFNLTVTFPAEKQEDVANSLRLWLLFGGVGARTRRGLGTLSSANWPGWKSQMDIEQWLQNILLVPKQEPIPWPTMFGARLVWSETHNRDSVTTWSNWIKRYQSFRQNRIDKKKGQPSPFGKSTWPEPDAIRDLHRTGNLIPSSSYFPRGAYGLPIIFHFPKPHIERGTDVSYTLEGNNDRWASPVILKIVPLSNERALKVCLILNSPQPPRFQIYGHSNDKSISSNAVPMAQSSLRKKAPLNNRDPYTALLEHMGGDIITLGGGK